jgi:hypothetical protein
VGEDIEVEPSRPARLRGLKIQHAIAVVAGLVVVVGIVLGAFSISVPGPEGSAVPDSEKGPVPSGSAFGGVDPKAAEAAWWAQTSGDIGRALNGSYGYEAAGVPTTSCGDQCALAVSTRRTITWPPLGVGGAALLVSLLISVPRAEQSREPQGPVTV